jgi:hypothetical protein
MAAAFLPEPPKPKPQAAAPSPHVAPPPPAQVANRYAALAPVDAVGGAAGAAPEAGALPPARLQSKAARKATQIEGKLAAAAEDLAAYMDEGSHDAAFIKALKESCARAELAHK